MKSDYRQSVLDWMLWVDENIIDPQKVKRMKCNIRKNIKAVVGDKIYCPKCHKRMKKQFPGHITCGKPKCDERIKSIIEIFNNQNEELDEANHILQVREMA